MDEPETTVVAAMVAAVGAIGVRLRPRFRRGKAHGHACAYLRGPLSDAERKNGWPASGGAEQAGYRQPRAIQRVLDRSVWDADAVRDDLRAYVLAALGDPAGVLVVDATGFLKQGTRSVGVQRQYSGTAGRIENCQVGVVLGYASAQGRAGIDRALYLPREWTADPARCAAAGVPADITFQTQPQLARAMLERALDGGVPAAWVTADEVDGNDYACRHALAARGQAYVVAVKRTHTVSTWPPYGPPGQARACDLVAALPAEAWQRRSCGAGAQGERVYDWAGRRLRPALQDGWGPALRARRHPTKLDELACYLVYAPAGTPLEDVVRAAGTRWASEDTLQLATGQVGLDHYAVRSWPGWHRHSTLALWALAILATEAAQAKGGTARQPAAHPGPLAPSGASAAACPSCVA